MTSQLVTFESPPVKKCRVSCTKKCCINCDHFLSATVDSAMRGMLLNTVCSCFMSVPTDLMVGITKCIKYIPPRSK